MSHERGTKRRISGARCSSKARARARPMKEETGRVPKRVESRLTKVEIGRFNSTLTARRISCAVSRIILCKWDESSLNLHMKRAIIAAIRNKIPCFSSNLDPFVLPSPSERANRAADVDTSAISNTINIASSKNYQRYEARQSRDNNREKNRQQSCYICLLIASDAIQRIARFAEARRDIFNDRSEARGTRCCSVNFPCNCDTRWIDDRVSR